MTRTIALGLCAALLLCSNCSKRTPSPSVRQPVAVQSVDRVAIRAELARHRALQIERLGAYAQAGQFPHNYAQPTSAHIFRDDDGRLCAVANLVHRDGRDDLVEATVRDHNDLAVVDVHDGPMLAWIESSGLTQDELVRIQAPAPRLVRHAPQAPPARDIARKSDDDESRMKDAVIRHVEQVRRELLADTEKSLDAATERLVLRKAMVAQS
jgi:hypothetical protein